LRSHHDEGLPIEVVAYSGSSGEEEPRQLRLAGRSSAVERILDRWREPGGRYFRVLTDDRHVHLLVCRDADLSWRLVVEPRKLR